MRGNRVDDCATRKGRGCVMNDTRSGWGCGELAGVLYKRSTPTQ